MRRNGIEIARRFIKMVRNALEQQHRGLGLGRSAREISQTVCEIVRKTIELDQTRRDPPWMGVETIPRRRETGQIALEFRQMIRRKFRRRWRSAGEDWRRSARTGGIIEDGSGSVRACGQAVSPAQRAMSMVQPLTPTTDGTEVMDPDDCQQEKTEVRFRADECDARQRKELAS